MSLNMNSPIVQAMMAQNPQGLGGIPVYNGPAPTVETGFIPSPNPSPKDMVMQAGQQIQQQYYPYQQQPAYGYPQPQQYSYPQYEYQNRIVNQQYVGGPSMPSVQFTGALAPQSVQYGNSAVQQAFAGYVNPYLGQGMYGGAQGYNSLYSHIDPETRQLMIEAEFNGHTLQEEIQNQSSLWKTICKIAHRSLGLSDEEMDKVCSKYDVQYKKPQQPQEVRVHPQVAAARKHNWKIGIWKGDKKIRTIESAKLPASIRNRNHRLHSLEAERDIARWEAEKVGWQNYCSYMHSMALERRYDNASLVELMNECGPALYLEDKRRADAARKSLISQAFNIEGFKKLVRDRNNMSKTDKKKIDGYIDHLSKKYPSTKITDIDYEKALEGIVKPEKMEEAIRDVKKIVETRGLIEEAEKQYGLKIPRDEYGNPIPGVNILDLYMYNHPDRPMPDSIREQYEKSGTKLPSFFQDPLTGNISINAPEFMDDKLEGARRAFKQAITGSQ